MRTNPLTGWNALFINEQHPTHIEGLSVLENRGIVDTLLRHIDKSRELQCRVKWEANTVVIFDNRSVLHSAMWDYWPSERIIRKVTVHGSETPYFDPSGGSQNEWYVAQNNAGSTSGKAPPSWNRTTTGIKKSVMKDITRF